MIASSWLGLLRLADPLLCYLVRSLSPNIQVAGHLLVFAHIAHITICNFLACLIIKDSCLSSLLNCKLHEDRNGLCFHCKVPPPSSELGISMVFSTYLLDACRHLHFTYEEMEAWND